MRRRRCCSRWAMVCSPAGSNRGTELNVQSASCQTPIIITATPDRAPNTIERLLRYDCPKQNRVLSEPA